MKWLLVAPVCLFFSVISARGDAADDVFAKGEAAIANNDFPGAAALYMQIDQKYPNSKVIDEARLRAGFAYLHAGDFASSIAILKKAAAPSNKPDTRIEALFFLGQSYFSQGHKLTDVGQSKAAYSSAVDSLAQTETLINQNPTPDNKGLLEDTIYYRALSESGGEDYAGAVKDLNQLLQAFPNSLTKPDYLLLLGNVYAILSSNDLGAKKPMDLVNGEAKQALDTFDLVSRDPNALIQANEANQRKADVLYFLASLSPDQTDGYAKALEAYRLVRRKDDLIGLQQAHLEQLKVKAQQQVQSGASSLVNENSRIIQRETGRLADLKEAPDPIIQALIRIAECYVSMRQADEARTVLHRLENISASLTPDQIQEIDFQVIFSYVLGKQTEKADAALTDYLAKHPGDPQADSISVGIGSALMGRKDYDGVIKQADRSMKDFPTGKHFAEAISMKVEALTKLGRIDESNKILDDYVSKNPSSPVAVQLLLSKGQNLSAQGDLAGALAAFQKVKDNNSAGDYQSAAAAFYINTLQSLNRYDDVITESKAFEAKFPKSPALPTILTIEGVAMDKKQDPAAVAALQDVAKRFPDDEQRGSYALYYVVSIQQREGHLPEMAQAIEALRTAYPTAYTFIAQSTDFLSDADVKAKKFDEALAAYKPLLDAPKPEVAAAARNKTGTIYLAWAKSMGSYGSMQVDARADGDKRLAAAEDAFIGTLKSFPDDLSAVSNAFQGLYDLLVQKRSWGLLKDPDMEAYLAKAGAPLTSGDMPTHLELAKAGLVFVYRDGKSQYPAALDRFTKALAASPNLRLTRGEADRYGQLQIVGKNYPGAIATYTALDQNSDATDVYAKADAYFGIGAAYLAQGDVAKAKDYFTKMKALPGGAAWSPHSTEADFGLAVAAEQAGDTAGAKTTFASIMRAPTAGATLQARAILEYGRCLEKEGHLVKAPAQTDIEYATHYYEQVNLFYGGAVPDLSAEGLYLAAQAYTKGGDAAGAAKASGVLKSTYAKTAPDWAAKAP